MTKTLATVINSEKISEYMEDEYQQCTKDQFLREFWKNAEQAIIRHRQKNNLTPEQYQGKIRVFSRLLKGKVKLCVADNGIGMNNRELETFLRELKSSHKQKTDYHNFGIGSKVSASVPNTVGIMYESWKNGKGYMCIYGKGPDNTYGILQMSEVGADKHSVPLKENYLEEQDCPNIIKNNGTMVTFLGTDFLESDTTDFKHWKLHATKAGKGWVLKYYNNKIHSMAPNIDFRAMGYDNSLVKVSGLNADSLSQNTLQNGVFDAGGGNYINWYILKPYYNDKGGKNRQSGHAQKDYSQHTAIICEDEVYEKEVRKSVMQKCGISFGDDIILHFVLNKERWTPNKYRVEIHDKENQATRFFNSKESLRIFSLFKNNLPKAIEDNQSKKMSEALKTKSNTSSLNEYLHMFAVSRAIEEGTYGKGNQIVGKKTQFSPVDLFSSLSNKEKTTLVSPKKAVIAKGEKNQKKARTKKTEKIPTVLWNDHSDRPIAVGAAEYDDTNDLVFMNASYEVFDETVNDITKHNLNGYDVTDIKLRVKGKYGEAVASHVMYQRKNRARRNWNTDEINHSFQPSALTACVNGAMIGIIDQVRREVREKSLGDHCKKDQETSKCLNGSAKPQEYVNGQLL